MFILHVDLTVKPGSQPSLEEAFRDLFRPAVSRQEGFRAVDLLRPDEDRENYRLTIAFVSRAFQQKWVATDLHGQVWPQIENQCSDWVVCCYTAV